MLDILPAASTQRLIVATRRCAPRCQLAAYRHAGAIWPNKNTFRLFMDIDEYPFFPEDTAPGFLLRYLNSLRTKVGIVYFKNVVFGGHGGNFILYAEY